MFVDRPLGIDLGTTHSEIALLDPSERNLHIHADKFGRRTMPSAIAWDPKQEAFVVGRAARSRRGQIPPPIESIKRRMGQAFKITAGPHELTPEEVSAKILAELRDRMRDFLESSTSDLDVRVKRAVITVPAYFDAPQVEATRRAGELASLDVIALLQEPTAAAIYHTWKRHLGDGNFLIYDLGGGTFDVSVLRCLGGEYQVLAIDGDNHLGGDDFDRRFAERLRRSLVDSGYALELDVQSDPEDERRFMRLVHLAQEVKESLSTRDVVHLAKQDVMMDKAGESVSIEREIGRAEYDEAIDDLVRTTLRCCERALERSQEVAGVGLADIDHVVLVGGSTRVPLVMKRVREALCAGKSQCTEPLQDEVDTCVALGAAIFAAQVGGVRIGDDAMQILWKSPLVGHGDRLRLSFVAENTPLNTAELVITSSSGQELGKTALGEPGNVSRVTVPLEAREENPTRIEARDAHGQLLASLPFALYRGDVKPRASALSQPAVIAKDISLEVMRARRRERKVLIPRGTGLPTTKTHEFATGDRSGAVVLRLLQNRLPIKTLVLDVPLELPLGTPVVLELSCDDAMRIEARAKVAGRELWARVDAAPRTVVNIDEIDALLADAERISKTLWGREALSFRREFEPLANGLRELVSTDPTRITALASALKELVEEFESRDAHELSPPFQRFEAVLDALRTTVYLARAPLLGLDQAAWEARINELHGRASAAWESSDAAEWRRVHSEAQALLETAQAHELGSTRIDDPSYLVRRATGLHAWAMRLERALLDSIPSSTEELRTIQLNERDRLLDALRRKVTEPLERLSQDARTPTDVRQRLDALSSELERLDHAAERLPSLGVVSDRRG